MKHRTPKTFKRLTVDVGHTHTGGVSFLAAQVGLLVCRLLHQAGDLICVRVRMAHQLAKHLERENGLFIPNGDTVIIL